MPHASGASLSSVGRLTETHRVLNRNPLLRRHRPRFSILVGSDESKNCFRHFAPCVIGPASPPGLHSDRHRGGADFHNTSVQAHFISDKDRFMKNHSVHGNSRATTATPPAGGVCSGKVHLGHQPSAENVSGRVGIRRHGDRANERFTFRWVS
jgi:hypothetical protein